MTKEFHPGLTLLILLRQDRRSNPARPPLNRLARAFARTRGGERNEIARKWVKGIEYSKESIRIEFFASGNEEVFEVSERVEKQVVSSIGAKMAPDLESRQTHREAILVPTSKIIAISYPNRCHASKRRFASR
jgi:hypothetical protein